MKTFITIGLVAMLLYPFSSFGQKNKDVAKFNEVIEKSRKSTEPFLTKRYAEEALLIAKNSKYDLPTAQAKTLLAKSQIELGDYVNAAINLHATIDEYKKRGIDIGIATNYTYLGQINRIQGNESKTFSYYRKACDIFKEQADSLRLTNTYFNIGYSHFKFSNIDSAEFYLELANKLNKINPNARFEGYILGNLGLCRVYKNDLVEADMYLTRAIDILSTFKDFSAIAEFKSEISNIYLKNNQLKFALKYALEADSIATLANNVGIQIITKQHLVNTLEKQDLITDAYTQLIALSKLKESQLNIQTKMQVEDLQWEHELSAKNAEIIYLEKVSLVQKILMVGLCISLLFLGILSIIWFRNFKAKKRANLLLNKQARLLASQRDELQALNASRNKFFSIISHDLRGPVAAFNGIGKLIEHYISVGDEDQLKQISGHLNTSAENLGGLLDNLLGWSVSEQGEFPYRPEPVHLFSLVSDTLGMYSTMAHSKNIELTNAVSHDVFAYADHNSLTTIIRNLVNNALKFTGNGGEIKVSAEVNHDNLIVHVKDNGIGMSAEKMRTIFKLRDEKRTWGTNGEKGLGLGLRLAYEFAQLNNGSLTVRSKERIGTTFSLTLPLSQAPNSASTQSRQAIQKEVMV